MQVKEVMTTTVEVSRPGTGAEEVARQMQRRRLRAIPVCDDQQHVLGIVTDRDITLRVVAAGNGPGMVTIDEIMSRNVVTCFEDQDLEECVSLMETHKVRLIPVLGRDQRLAGIVSVDDLAVRAQADSEVKETLRRITKASRA